MMEEQGDYICGLPLVEFKKRGFRSYFSMPMGTYGGLLCRNWSEAKAVKFLEELQTTLRTVTALGIQIVDFEMSHAFLKRLGFKALEATTHIVGLDEVNTQNLLNKRGYQQAIKKGLVVRKIATEADLKHCYQMYLQTCRRHKSRPKYPESFYQNLFEEGKNSEWLLWWLAEFEGKIVGYQINFNYRNLLIMWDAGFDSDGLNLRASDYLMGESLKWCRENRVTDYNLGGSPPGAEGLIHFKEQWGGKVKQYFVYEKTLLFGKLSDFLRGR